MAEFPAASFLGYSINMPSIAGLDTESAIHAVLTARRMIDFDEYDTRDLNVDGTVYKVPKSISVDEEETVVNSFVHYRSGDEAAAAFENDPSLASRFVSITGGPSIMRATRKLYDREYMYAYYSFGRHKYLAALNDYTHSLDAVSLKKRLEDLPTPFNGENKDVLAAYKMFFQRFGTHVITKVQFGAHYQLHLWSANSNSSVNPYWADDIKADYDGIPSNGEFNSDIRNSDQYKTYLDLIQKVESVNGGDLNKAQALRHQPTWSAFQAWVATSEQNTSALSVGMDDLWSLMEKSGDDDMIEAAPRIKEAFDYIVDHQQA